MFDLDQLLQPAALTEPEPLLWQTIAAYEYLDDAVLLPQLLHLAHFSDDTGDTLDYPPAGRPAFPQRH
jgi:hypothetical protein